MLQYEPILLQQCENDTDSVACKPLYHIRNQLFPVYSFLSYFIPVYSSPYNQGSRLYTEYCTRKIVYCILYREEREDCTLYSVQGRVSTLF